jgi:hypothetical protein
MPVLTAPANQRGWPDVVAKEVTENLHKFVSNGGCHQPHQHQPAHVALTLVPALLPHHLRGLT